MDRIPGSLWAPGRSAGYHVTSTRRGLWHSTEGSSIAGAEGAYRSHGGWPHATWNPNTGEIHQHLLPGAAARALENHAGGVETNRMGALQIETVAFAAHPFTDGPLVGLDRLLVWLRANGVPDRWPAGSPLGSEGYGYSNPQRSPGLWLIPGHFAHSQVPENAHWNPGRIDIRKIIGAPAPAPEQPAHPLEDDVLAVVQLPKDEVVDGWPEWSLWAIGQPFYVPVDGTTALKKIAAGAPHLTYNRRYYHGRMLGRVPETWEPLPGLEVLG